jgi:hypothetical protein
VRIIDVDVPDKPIAIAAIGDIQFTGTGNLQMGCSVKHLKEHLEWLANGSHLKGHEVYYCGTGDMVDMMSPSNREAYRYSGIYSSSKRVISYQMKGIVDELAEIILPYMKGRTVTLCRGHHWFYFDDWKKHPDLFGADYSCEDTDTYLGRLLGFSKDGDPPYGVTEGLAHITFRWPNGATYQVLVTHGEGNGQTMTYGINKQAKLASLWEDIDAMIMGHTHKLASAKLGRMRISSKKLVEREIRLITSGSFLKGYLVDDEVYAEMKQLGPLALGASAISVYPKEKKRGRWLFESVTLER